MARIRISSQNSVCSRIRALPPPRTQLSTEASVFPEKELHEMWQYKYKRPLALQFLYVYSFPHRINMSRLIELGILASVNDAPRGFRPISAEQFNLILKETKSDESFIVD